MLSENMRSWYQAKNAAALLFDYVLAAFHPIQSSTHFHVPSWVRSANGSGGGNVFFGYTTGLPAYAATSCLNTDRKSVV